MAQQNLTKRADQREDIEEMRASARSPAVDIYENDAEYLVVADLPGVQQAAIELRYESNHLTLEAKADSKASFFRRFVVPEGVDRDKTEAALKDGVLKLHLPKGKEHRPRQISVRTG